MRTPQLLVSIASMTDPDAPAIMLVIELYGRDDPIEGALIEPAIHASPFRGWLALTALIDAARGSRPPDTVGRAETCSDADDRSSGGWTGQEPRRGQ
jgi:hypothetical protein